MILEHLNLILTLNVLAFLTLPTLAFIDSPMDWVFVPNHTRGLVCPSLRYGCCPDLNTWRHGSPCEHPKATKNPESCYKRKEWACCQVDDDTFSCTTGFQKDKKDGAYGWRSGTSEKYFGIGKGALTVQEKQALGRSS
ncbi:hypothetical protein BU25DRAFT_495908 [Macroventuria anomochaeta]|uniref:Uncharacterized protein n=1 Tax=Macroventuria anomochaeta TaxID=301207 RepID=A0ACB6RHM7_9PLEO|nr:uncharacterized protein BU25DRAFT_495908 [Macroventuria anomochaeta]KAF2621253.1 hypothetical protein BU25DRAFT_495908 [Macroventuria anomochaeta]